MKCNDLVNVFYDIYDEGFLCLFKTKEKEIIFLSYMSQMSHTLKQLLCKASTLNEYVDFEL